jgi:hypothetical protein
MFFTLGTAAVLLASLVGTTAAAEPEYHKVAVCAVIITRNTVHLSI